MWPHRDAYADSHRRAIDESFMVTLSINETSASMNTAAEQ